MAIKTSTKHPYFHKNNLIRKEKGCLFYCNSSQLPLK